MIVLAISIKIITFHFFFLEPEILKVKIISITMGKEPKISSDPT